MSTTAEDAAKTAARLSKQLLYNDNLPAYAAMLRKFAQVDSDSGRLEHASALLVLLQTRRLAVQEAVKRVLTGCPESPSEKAISTCLGKLDERTLRKLLVTMAGYCDPLGVRCFLAKYSQVFIPKKAFVQAARHKRWPTIRVFLDSRNCRHPDWLSDVVTYAVSVGDDGLIQFTRELELTPATAGSTTVDAILCRLLDLAVQTRDEGKLEFLLQLVPPTPNAFKWAILNDRDFLSRLFQKGPPPEETIAWVAKQGMLADLKFLLEKGGKITDTVVKAACSAADGAAECLGYLYEKGLVPAMWHLEVASRHSLECMKEILSRLHVPPSEQALAKATIARNTRAIQLLLDYRAQVVAQHVIIAAGSPSAECLKLLLDNMKEPLSSSDLSSAITGASSCNPEGLDILLSMNGAKVKDVAVTCAARCGRADILRRLLTHGGTVTSEAEYYAQGRRKADCLELLLQHRDKHAGRDRICDGTS